MNFQRDTENWFDTLVKKFHRNVKAIFKDKTKTFGSEYNIKQILKLSKRHQEQNRPKNTGGEDRLLGNTEKL